MVSGVAVVVGRLRERRGEIEGAIFARVREVAPDSVGDPGTEYVEGLRAAIAAAVEFGLAGLERGEGAPAAVPREVVEQAQRAARSGVSLQAVLRRYIVGHALLWDYVMEEADQVRRSVRASGLREMLSAQATLLDELVIAVTREHVAELQRATRSREHRLLDRVRELLHAGDPGWGTSPGALEHELDYDLDAHHLGVIARGAECEALLRGVAEDIGCRVLAVQDEEGKVWAWLGGRHAPRMVDFERALAAHSEASGVAKDASLSEPLDVSVVVGEPGSGLEGWRLTHRQAQGALSVAVHSPQRLTRYADVALLAAALSDPTLACSLIEMYLSPLEDTGAPGPVLRDTLHAYLAAERNVSSTAVALGVARSTVVNRLRTIEERLGRTLHSNPAELEIALQLDSVGFPTKRPEPPVADF